MTRDRDIERALDHWFADGPSVIPDRVMVQALQRIDRTPQRRLAALLSRYRPMSASLRLGLAAAAVLAVVVAGMTLVRPGPGPGTTPSAISPSTSASTSENLVDPPGELAHWWLGQPRTIEGLEPGDVAQFQILGRTFAFDNGTSQALQSRVGITADELVLVSAGPGSIGCQQGDEGRYPFSTSPGGSTLTIEEGTDDCAARRAGVVGTWQRAACNDPNGRCLGIVEAGTYRSQYFDPNAPTTLASLPDYGALTWAVPDGWANAGDEASLYALMRAASYETGAVNEGANPADNISLLARASAAALHVGCPDGVPEPGVGTDRDSLSTWLVGHPGLDVTQQPATTIDGLEATVLDLAVAPDWTETCDEVNPFIAAPLFVGGYHWAIAKDDRMRVVLLDLPSGRAVVVAIDPQDPSTFDQFVAEAMQIVESFDFK